MPYSYRYQNYPALASGEKFTDPETYTSVTVESININTQNPVDSRLTVRVAFNDIPTDVGDACIDGTPSGQCDEVGNNGRLCVDGAFIESDCLTCGCPSNYMCNPTASGGPTCIQQSICTDSYLSNPNTHPGTCTDTFSQYGGTCIANGAFEYYCSNGSGKLGYCTSRFLKACNSSCNNGICVTCLTNTDCNDNDGCTFDTCQNAGLATAACVNTQVPNTCGDRECGSYGCSECGSCTTGEFCTTAGYCELPCAGGILPGQCNDIGDSALYCDDGQLVATDCRDCGCTSGHACVNNGGDYSCQCAVDCNKYPNHSCCPTPTDR